VAETRDLGLGQLFYAPDGSAIDTQSFVDRTHMRLLRLDPSTLAVAARRDFTGAHQILLLAQQ
jgi:hypothetical protein